MKLFYSSNGHLQTVNSDNGVTLAVFFNGQLHADYDNEETRNLVSNLLLFDSTKIAPPEPTED